MKIIPKFQQGSRFNIWTPLQAPSGRPQASSSGQSSKSDDNDNDKGKLTEKDLFTMLKDVKGLPNEMQALFSEFNAELQMARDFGRNGIADIASTYANTLAKLRQYEYNKEIFKEAYDRAVEAGNLNDIAITVSGHVLVQNEKGEMKAITPETYVKNRDKYSPVTNSNLLYLRSHSSAYIGRNDIFQTVENGIGLENISKMIQERIQLGGKQTTSSDSFFSQGDVMSARAATREQQVGLQALQQIVANGPEGYYKLHNSSSTNEAAINAALGYIYTTLPKNAKIRLALETKNGTQKEVGEIIYAMLLGKLEVSSTPSVSYIGTKDGTSGTGGTGTSGQLGKEDETAASRFLNGYGDVTSFNFNLGANGNIRVDTISLPLVNASGNQLLGNMKPLSEVSESPYAGMFDWNNASMGMGILNPSGLNQVIEKNGRVYSIDFPVYRTPDGHIVPDLRPDRVEKKQAAEKEIKAKGININDPESRKQNYQVINQIYEKYGLVAPYDSNGDISNKSWARFAVMEAYADNRNLEGEHSSLLRQIGDYEEKNLINTLKEIDKKYSPGGGFSNWISSLAGGKHEGIYEGLLWIPMPYGYNSAQITEKMKPEASYQLDQMDQARRITQQQSQSFSFGNKP